jgi:proton-translocating NADH-quinone oxidoreductase chain M
MPMFPFHIWLPEAHVEAPTTASVILAALLLKLGGYGFIRFIPVFPYAYIFFNPLMYTLGVISIIYASLVTIRQIDLKKIIAYSSIAHMNLCTIGIFSLNYQGIQGSIFLMLGHGVVSSALFFLVGMLYDRYYTKFLRYYGGLVITMPIFASIFFFFSMANLGFPGTCNFIGEFLILAGATSKNMSIMILTASGMLFSSLYSIWLFNRLCFGNLKVQYIKKYKDLKGIEFFCLFPLIILTIILGVAPDVILGYTYQEIKCLTLLYR